jgi:putative addiction module killer protein
LAAHFREILLCHAPDGSIPFLDWLNSLDVQIRARVRVRIDRLEDGNFGDAKFVGDEVFELRLAFGPGYRVYFGQIGAQVHLISGGDKSTQSRDIPAAIQFWRSHE